MADGDSAYAKFCAGVARAHATGTATEELSYYPFIKDLLDAAAGHGSAKVIAVQHPSAEQGRSADLGLFGQHQLDAGAVVGAGAWDRQMPEYGVVEAKGPGEPVEVTAASDQVARYTRHYGKTLVTNLRQWCTVTLGADGRSLQTDEGIVLADSEQAFWRLVRGDASAAACSPQDLMDYLSTAVEAGAPVASARALARILATHARRALHRIEDGQHAALEPLRKELEQALGVTYGDAEGTHVFRSGLVQTLFYGLFSAWVLDARDRLGIFQWQTVSYDLRLPPIIKTLFEQYVMASNVAELGIGKDLDFAADALNRVVTNTFFEQFEHGTAIDYFYEPFLEAYDPELRDRLGVWYTPKPVVDYVVDRVDQSLIHDFNLPLGLADDSVVVLDPATGTGTFLHACLRRISRTLLGVDPGAADGQGIDPDLVDGLAAAKVRDAAIKRLFGFELLPAPFVIAHMRLGMFLQHLGVPLSKAQRAGVYLTNALTGWSEPNSSTATLFPTLNEERDAAASVKQNAKVLVVLGNPPYNAFVGAGTTTEEADLIAPYKTGIVGRNSLDDLYVRFIRVAERRIAEETGKGIVAYVTNRSFLRRPSFHVMRKHLLDSFDSIDVVDLNGDRDETGKRTPDARPDPSIFATSTSPGIAEGAAISIFVRRGPREADAPPAEVTYRSLWGKTKASDLTRLSGGLPPEDPASDTAPTVVASSVENFYSFQPVAVGADYYTWISLPDLAETPPEYGMHEARGGGLIDADRDALAARMRAYLDPQITDDDLPGACAPLRKARSGFVPAKARALLTGRPPNGTTTSARPFDDAKIRPYMARPYDRQYAYVERDHRLWVASQPRLAAAEDEGAWFLYTLRTAENTRNGYPMYASNHVGDQHTLYYTAFLLPTRLPADERAGDTGAAPTLDGLTEGDPARPARPNLSQATRAYLRALGLDPDDQGDADLVFLHALAFVNAPLFTEQHGDALRQQYPRILLPATGEALRASAALGAQIRSLFDDQAEAPSGPLLSRLGQIRRADGAAVDPDAGHLAVTTPWGAVQGHAVMPRAGRLDTVAWNERDLHAGAAQAEVSAGAFTADDVPALLGAETVSIYVNDQTRIERVPSQVWALHIGGKQVIKKWLSYRPRPILGRDLTTAEAGHLTRTVRKLSALLLLNPALDQNYTDIVAASSPADDTSEE